MKRNCVFAALAALILWIVGREALAQAPGGPPSVAHVISGQRINAPVRGRAIYREPFAMVGSAAREFIQIEQAGSMIDVDGTPLTITGAGRWQFNGADWAVPAALVRVSRNSAGNSINGSLIERADFTGMTTMAHVINDGAEISTIRGSGFNQRKPDGVCLMYTNQDRPQLADTTDRTRATNSGHAIDAAWFAVDGACAAKGPTRGACIRLRGEVTDMTIRDTWFGGNAAAIVLIDTPDESWPNPDGTTGGRNNCPKRIRVVDCQAESPASKLIICYGVPLDAVQLVGTSVGCFRVVDGNELDSPGGGPSDGPDDGTVDNPPSPPPGSFVPAPAFGPQAVTAPRQDWAGRSPSIGYFPVALTGSPTAPAIFNFANADGTKQRVPHKFYFTGSYAVINGLDAHKIEVGPGSHHVVFQNCRAGGDASRKGAGFAIGGSGANPTHNIVIADCEASDNGDWQANFDEDFHGVAIGGNVSYVWVTGSKFFHNSGDGIQINAGSLANQSTLHHIFITGNEMWENKQTGAACKQARNVVFAGNYVHDHRPIGTSPSAWGAGFGHQYGAGPIWYVGNRIERCSFGIQSGSTSGLGDGQDAYYIFNRIENIRRHADYAYNPATAWSNAGLSLVGNPNKYVIGNWIHAADGGIYFPGGVRVLVEGNVLANILNQDTWLEDPNGNQAFNVLSNLAWPTAELRRANQPLPWPIGNIVADPATAGRTWIPSPEAVAIFDKYQAEFGVDLRTFKGAVPWAVGVGR